MCLPILKFGKIHISQSHASRQRISIDTYLQGHSSHLARWTFGVLSPFHDHVASALHLAERETISRTILHSFFLGRSRFCFEFLASESWTSSLEFVSFYVLKLGSDATFLLKGSSFASLVLSLVALDQVVERHVLVIRHFCVH